MIFTPGSTSQSIDIQLVDDSGLPLTGKVAADFPNVYWSIGGNTAATQITLSDLSLITSTYSSGGIKERTGAAGIYRLDLPNAVFANAGKVRIYGEASGKHLLCPAFTVAYVAANTVQVNGTAQTARDLGNALPTAAPNASGGLLTFGSSTGQINPNAGKTPATIAAGDIATDAITAASLKADAVTKIQSGLSTYAGGDTSGVTSLLSRLSTTRAGYLDNLATVPAHAGDAMTLTSGERTSIAAAVEAAILNEGDSQAVLDAIIAKIQEANPDFGNLTLNAIAEATAALLLLNNGTVDTMAESIAAILSDYARRTGDYATAAQVATALNNYDAPTKAELDAAQDAIQADISQIETGGGGGGGLTTEQAAQLLSTYRKTLALGSAYITVSAPVAVKGDISVLRGSDYLVAINTAIEFVITGPAVEANKTDFGGTVQYQVGGDFDSPELDKAASFEDLGANLGIKVSLELTASEIESIRAQAIPHRFVGQVGEFHIVLAKGQISVTQ